MVILVAVMARRLLEHWERATVTAKFLPHLGLPPSSTHLERLLQISTLEPPFQELCARGRLALTAAASLAAWKAADRDAALPFLTGLPFSQSKQEQFLEDVELLARREGVSIREILSRQQLRQYLQNPNLNLNERAEAVRQVLPELLRDLGDPFPAVWAHFHAAHPEREAARLFAKVLGQVETHGLTQVVSTITSINVITAPRGA